MYRTDEFTKLMEELSIIKLNTFDKLIEDDVCKWSCAFCPVRRYDLMTTNIAESMKSVMRQAVDNTTYGVYSCYAPEMVS